MQPEPAYSFATSPSGVTTMNMTGFLQNQNRMNRECVTKGPGSRAYFTNNFTSINAPLLPSMYNNFNGNERNRALMKNNAERNFKSNKAMHDMTRVLSDGGFICIPGSKRPTTAVVGPSLTQAHGLGRRRMASNSILNANARNRSSNRRFMYNKESY